MSLLLDLTKAAALPATAAVPTSLVVVPVVLVLSPLHAHPLGLVSESELRSAARSHGKCDGCTATVTGAGFICALGVASPASHHSALYCLRCVVAASESSSSSSSSVAPATSAAEVKKLLQLGASAVHPHRLHAASTAEVDAQESGCSLCARRQYAGHYRCSEGEGEKSAAAEEEEEEEEESESSPPPPPPPQQPPQQQQCTYSLCPGCLHAGLKASTLHLVQNEFVGATASAGGLLTIRTARTLTVGLHTRPLDLLSYRELRALHSQDLACDKCFAPIVDEAAFAAQDHVAPNNFFCASCVLTAEAEQAQADETKPVQALRSTLHPHALLPTHTTGKCTSCSKSAVGGHYACVKCRTDHVCLACAVKAVQSHTAMWEVPAERAALAIQCAARQKLARKEVAQRRAQKNKPPATPPPPPVVEPEPESEPVVEAVAASDPEEEARAALVIQSAVRTRAAKKEVALRKEARQKKEVQATKTVRGLDSALEELEAVPDDPEGWERKAQQAAAAAQAAAHATAALVLEESEDMDPLASQDCEMCESEPAVIQCLACASAGTGLAFCASCSEQVHSSAKGKLHKLCGVDGRRFGPDGYIAPKPIPAWRAALVKSHEIAHAHSTLPEHLHLCACCLHATVVYRCAPCQREGREEDTCASCFWTNHQHGKAKEHAVHKTLVPGAESAAFAPHEEADSDPLPRLNHGQGVPEDIIEDEVEEDQPVATPKRPSPPPLPSAPQPTAKKPKPIVVVEEPAAPVIPKPTPKPKPSPPNREQERERLAEQSRKLAEWEAMQRAPALVAEPPRRKKKRSAASFPDTRDAGVLEHVFSLLAQPSSVGAQPALGGVFHVPFSALFHNSLPFAIIATDEQGFLTQKHWGALAREDVVASFGASSSAAGEDEAPGPDDTVALCFSLQAGVPALALNASQVRSLFGIHDIEIGPAAPHAAARPRGNFLLQRFVPSPGRHSTVYRLRADWLGVSDNDLDAAPQLAVSVCTNPHGRASAATSPVGGRGHQEGVPLDSALAFKTPGIREEPLDATGGSDESINFLKLTTTLRAFIGRLGLGTPVRMSLVVAPSKAEGDATVRWNFCFADLLQLNSLEPASVVAPAGPGVSAPTSLNPVQAPARRSPAKPRSIGRGEEMGIHIRSKTLDTPNCAKCLAFFAKPGEDSFAGQGTRILLRQVLLKWIPNVRYEYPEQMFSDSVHGVDMTHTADWHRVTVKVCGDCLHEIRSLKTIPARTQMQPWLAAAAESADGSPTNATPMLPYLARASVLHPDGSGFSAVLQPPAAQKSHKVGRVPLGVLLAGVVEGEPQKKHKLASSKSTPTLQPKHAIAGGAGTAPHQPHHPTRSRYQRRSQEGVTNEYEDDFESGGSALRSPSKPQGAGLPSIRSGAPSVTAAATPLSPFSSGQRNMPSNGGSGGQDPRERERERALAAAMNKSSSPYASHNPSSHQSPTRKTAQPSALQPLAQHHVISRPVASGPTSPAVTSPARRPATIAPISPVKPPTTRDDGEEEDEENYASDF